MTKDELMAAIRACAEKLGRAPTLRELLATGKKITRYGIARHFGGYTQALGVCGVSTPGSGRVVEVHDLFLDWAGVARAVGRIPTIADYDRHGRYSVRPLINRFGNWTNVPLALAAYAEQNCLASGWKDVLAKVSARREGSLHAKTKHAAPEPDVHKPRVHQDRPLLGPPLLPRPLIYGPTNESGVVYLFGSMASELGFVVAHIQTGFPDCEAARQVAPDRWQRVRVEFEYESRNFLKHLHRAEECDVIVCWIHNWPDCPLEVVELRSAPVLQSQR